MPKHPPARQAALALRSQQTGSLSPPTASTTLFPRNPTEWLVCGLLVLSVGLAFSSVAQNQFVSFDDGLYLYDTPLVQQGLSAESLKWAFTTGHAGNWHPLTWTAHTLAWNLFGSDPRGHHFLAVGLHAASSVLLFLLVVRMTSAPDAPASSRKNRKSTADSISPTTWPAAFVAGLFAIHPFRVESVAWASELKDVLCTLFWWLSIAAYVHFARRPTVLGYALLAGCFVLGLMSKPMIVSLPLILLLLDYWPLGRFPDRSSQARPLAKQALHLVLEKAPLILLAAAGSVATYIAQASSGTTEMLNPVEFHLRLANAALSTVAYLFQSVWPSGLCCFYPYPRASLQSTGWWRADVLGSTALIAIASAGAWWFGRRHKYLLVGWFWYLIALIPVVGIIQVGRQARADRYTYVPLVGVYLLMAWGAHELIESRFPAWRRLAIATATAVLLVLGVLTWRQTRTWHDDLTLFAHAAAVVPRNDTAERNLGSIYFLRNQPVQAIEHMQKSIEYCPEYAPSYRNLAVVLEKLGRPQQAEEYFREALQRDPQWTLCLCNLASMYSTSELPELYKPAEAVRLAEQAVRVSAGKDLLSWEVLSTAYAVNGQIPQAIEAADKGRLLAARNRDIKYEQGFARNIAILRARMPK